MIIGKKICENFAIYRYLYTRCPHKSCKIYLWYQVGRTVRDFFTRKDACATPRRYIGTCQATATPARKLTFAPDIIAGVEEDDFGVEAAKDLTGRVWKVFKVKLTRTLVIKFPKN